MAKTSKLIVLSEREQDHLLVSRTAKLMGSQWQVVLNLSQLDIAAQKLFSPTFFVDLDDPLLYNASSPIHWPKLAAYFTTKKFSHLLIAISEKPLSSYGGVMKLFEKTGFLPQHHFQRTSAESAEILLMFLIENITDPGFVGLKNFFSSSVDITSWRLENSKQREALVRTIETAFIERGMGARLSQKLASAADELLLNALYNAAMNESGQHIRKYLTKKADFDLPRWEKIFLEIASNEVYSAICVSDSHGSFPKQGFLKHLTHNFKKSELMTSKNTVGSGSVGLYTLYHSGFSIFVAARSRTKTDVILFFPTTKKLKNLKSQFHFVSGVFV